MTGRSGADARDTISPRKLRVGLADAAGPSPLGPSAARRKSCGLSHAQGRLRQLPALASGSGRQPRKRMRSCRHGAAGVATRLDSRARRIASCDDVGRHYLASEILLAIGRATGLARATVRRRARAGSFPARSAGPFAFAPASLIWRSAWPRATRTPWRSRGEIGDQAFGWQSSAGASPSTSGTGRRRGALPADGCRGPVRWVRMVSGRTGRFSGAAGLDPGPTHHDDRVTAAPPELPPGAPARGPE